MNRRGAVLFITFLMMLVLSGLVTGVAVFSHNTHLTGRSLLNDRQAFYVGEAGLQRARQALIAGTWSAATGGGNTYTETFGPGEYSVNIVDNGDTTRTITSSGYVPTIASYETRRQVAETSIPVTGGTNLSLAATAAASTEQASHPATHANDGSTSTSWRANTAGNGQWLRMDYGSATALVQIVIVEHQNITALSAVEYSSDAASWSSVSGLTTSTTGSGDNQTYTADFSSASARYFRVTFTASGASQKVGVDESRAYASTGLGVGTVSTQW